MAGERNRSVVAERNECDHGLVNKCYERHESLVVGLVGTNDDRFVDRR